MSTPVPDDRSHTMRIALISAIGVLAVIVVALGAWAVFRPQPKEQPARVYTPAVDSTATATGTVPAEPTATTASAGSTGTGTVPGQAPGAVATTPAIVRAKRTAFRLGTALYVAGEDGAGAKKVAQAPQGPFALSPDGTTLAYLSGGQLLLANTATAKSVPAGVAEAADPVWMPDSSAVLFVRAGANGVPAVWRVGKDGLRATRLAEGSGAAVSPDGATIAFLPSEGSSAASVLVSRSGVQSAVPVQGGDPIAIALSNDRLFVSTLSASGESTIWSMALDGTGSRQLVAPASMSAKAATFGTLLLSPDGTRLLYTAESDDGFSRMWIVPTAGGPAVTLSPRRDAYPIQWTSDGSAILFIEGNAFQGEDTALWRVGPDGSKRLMIVSGAVQ